MKRTTLAVFAALTLLVAAPLLAQENPQAYEGRSNPNAPSITEGSGLTITGSVVKSNDKQLTLRTETGIEHIQIVPDTQAPVDLEPGEDVSVDYTRTDEGVMIATKIRPEGQEPMVEESVAAPTAKPAMDRPEATPMAESSEHASMQPRESQAEVDTSATANLESSMNADHDYDANADLNTQADLDASADQSVSASQQESLPETGSALPLLGLLGLLSVGGAVGIRAAR